MWIPGILILVIFLRGFLKILGLASSQTHFVFVVSCLNHWNDHICQLGLHNYHFVRDRRTGPNSYPSLLSGNGEWLTIKRGLDNATYRGRLKPLQILWHQVRGNGELSLLYVKLISTTGPGIHYSAYCGITFTSPRGMGSEKTGFKWIS